MSRRATLPGSSLRALTVAAALSATLLSAPAAAQIGGPIGAPVGVPHGLPSGSSAYHANRAGALPPPVNNWGSNDAGRGDVGNRLGGGSRGNEQQRQAVEIPLPHYTIRQSGTNTGASGPLQEPRDPRDQIRGSRQSSSRDTASRDSGSRDTSARGRDDRAAEERLATRAVAAEPQAPKVDVLRDLVQRGQIAETGLGQPKNLNHAFSLYCEAASAGYPDALVRMGLMYAEGNGVEKSADAAGTLFGRAARFGSSLGADLAKRYPANRELLPQCLKGTIVERGTAERPATAAELAAAVQKLDSGVIVRNPIIGAARAKLVESVIAEARTFRLDPRLVLAVMATESGFDPNAKSQKNALGLMQLIPETAERFAVRNVLDPIDNMRGGMAYLRWLLSYFRGDVTLTLAAYNAGEGAVDKYNGVPPFTETLAYVQRIRAVYPHDRHPYDPAAATATSKTAQNANSNPAAGAAGSNTADARGVAGTSIARN